METNKTLHWYQANARTYAEKQDKYDVTKEQTLFTDVLDTIKGRSPRVLDFGCGCGRDTKLFLEKGYYVCSVDGSSSMVSQMLGILNDSDDYNPRKHRIVISSFDDFLTNECRGDYDGIWCMASLLHLETEELAKTVKTLYNNYLNSGGIMYMSFKFGNDSKTNIDGRYYNNMNKGKLLQDVVNFPVLSMKTYDSFTAESVRWYNIILRK